MHNLLQKLTISPDDTFLLGIVEKRINAANENSSVSLFKSLNKKRSNAYRIADSVIGHVMSYNESTKEIEIVPQTDYLERYFIPHDQSESSEWGPGRLGMITVYWYSYSGPRTMQQNADRTPAFLIIYSISDE